MHALIHTHTHIPIDKHMHVSKMYCFSKRGPCNGGTQTELLAYCSLLLFVRLVSIAEVVKKLPIHHHHAF